MAAKFLGQFLLERGTLTPAQLLAALDAQHIAANDALHARLLVQRAAHLQPGADGVAVELAAQEGELRLRLHDGGLDVVRQARRVVHLRAAADVVGALDVGRDQGAHRRHVARVHGGHVAVEHGVGRRRSPGAGRAGQEGQAQQRTAGEHRLTCGRCASPGR